MKNEKSKKLVKHAGPISKIKKSQKPRPWLVFLFSLLAIIVVGSSVIGVAFLSKFYFNLEHPVGDEAAALMGKIQFVLNYFPHIDWNHEWDAGQPGFWVYLPFMFYIGAGMVKSFNLTLPHTITLLGVISYIIIAIGIYGITHRLAKNRIIAIFAALLAITSQGLWYWDGAGYYSRTFGMGFYFLCLWAAIALVQKIEKQGKLFPLPKAEFFLTLIFFFIAGYSHAFTNFITIGSLLLIFFIALQGFRKKILASLMVIGSGLLLSAFYFLLMIQANFQYYSNQFFHRTYEPHYLRLFFNLQSEEAYAGAPEVSPLILPLAALALIFVIVFKKRFSGLTRAEKRIFWIFVILLFICLYYALQGSLFLPKLFYIFLLVSDLPFLISVFGAIIIGVVLAVVIRKLNIWLRLIIPIIFLGVLGFITVNGWLFPLEDKWIRRLYDYKEEAFVTRIKIDPDSKQFRMGTTNPKWAESFNYYYDVSQNRDYFAQGVVYDDWQFWQQATIWDIEYGYPETDFLIDWFSLKWILATSMKGDVIDDTSYEKFNARPDKYDLVYKENPSFYEFIPKEVSPILTATNVPNILVIGQEKGEGFNLLVRASALINLNSQSLIPVKGKTYIDQHSQEELEQFDMVYLYDYKYKNKSKASRLLKQYVENGGGLMVEGMLSPEYKKQSRNALFSPMPESQITSSQIDMDWEFEVGDHEITKGINFINFSPAVYDESFKWKIVSLEPTSDYQVILKADKNPVVLARELGQGRMVWLGMNLSYHITAYDNSEEMEFFKNIINWVSKNKIKEIETPVYQAKFVHPERREITVQAQASGILNKEYYFPAWQAYLEKDGIRKNLKIYRGGLDQQYIPLNQSFEPPYRVVMVYGQYWSESIGQKISIITLILLLIYLFEGRFYSPFIGRLWQRTFGRFKLKTSSWWDKDEE